MRRYSLILLAIGVGVVTAVFFVMIFQSGFAAAQTDPDDAKYSNLMTAQVTETVTLVGDMFLPLVNYHPYVPKALGSVSLLSGPTTCVTSPTHSSGVCYSVRVSCPGVVSPINATLKVGASLVPSNTGTVLFAGGYDGTYFWEGFTISNTQIISDVRMAGFQTVQIDWANPWFYTDPGNQAGMDLIGCRPATIARWVYDNLHQVGETSPYCAVGHSNGGTQVAYMLTHYGLDKILDEVVIESGPNFSRLNYSCINTPGFSSLYSPSGDRQFIDASYGYYTSSGPCYKNNPSWLPQWTSASLSSVESLAVYPHTLVAMTFGENDATITRNHGEDFFNFLLASGTPLLTTTEITGAGHGTTNTLLGKTKITSDIINGCVPQ
jgi:hypothetical protein